MVLKPSGHPKVVLQPQKLSEREGDNLWECTYLHQASVSKKHGRSVIITMRIGRQAKHYAIYFRRGYGDGKTFFGIPSHLLHDTRAYIAVKIAVSTQVFVSITCPRQGAESQNRSEMYQKSVTLSFGLNYAAKKESIMPTVRTEDRSNQRLDKRKSP